MEPILIENSKAAGKSEWKWNPCANNNYVTIIVWNCNSKSSLHPELHAYYQHYYISCGVSDYYILCKSIQEFMQNMLKKCH